MTVIKQQSQKRNINEKPAPTEKWRESFPDHIIDKRTLPDIHRQKWFDILRWHLLEKIPEKKIRNQPVDQKSADKENGIQMHFLLGKVIGEKCDPDKHGQYIKHSQNLKNLDYDIRSQRTGPEKAFEF